MSKRRINQQQSRRIKQTHEQRRSRAEQAIVSDGNLPLGPEQMGLLISSFGTQVEVEGEDGHVHRCVLRQNLGTLVAGDRVIWRQAANLEHGVVVAMGERHSILGRPNKQGDLRPVAANIDQMLIVVAPEPLLNRLLLDSYLVAAETLQMEPIIVLNKVDLLSKHHLHDINELLTLYAELGYGHERTSTADQSGIAELSRILKNKVSVFVGQSGVGKSSLIKALLPHETPAIADISHATAFGKHTTCNSTLYHLNTGGDIIDSPGVREFSLWQMPAAQIAHGFKEFRPYLPFCKFRDCSHHHEPGCAVHEALASGKINQQRLQSLHKLIEKWRR